MALEHNYSQSPLNVADGNGVYRSPFEAFYLAYPDREFYKMPPYTEYVGTVDSIISELLAGLNDPQTVFDVVAHHPTRLIRGVVDWKIENPYPALDLVNESLQIGQEVYEKSSAASLRLGRFRQRLMDNYPSLLEYVVKQYDDDATWLATDPELSYKSASNLASDLEGADILMIALAHGGIAPGMDTFLTYRNLTQSLDSVFYVARFSRHKKSDRTPQLSDEEADYLKSLAPDRQIVIFDEDSPTGATLQGARNFFQSQLFPGRHTKGVSNTRKKPVSVQISNIFEKIT